MDHFSDTTGMSQDQLLHMSHVCILKQVVKVVWYKAASPPHMDGSVVFARWLQCAPCNTFFLPSPQLKRHREISLAVFAQLTAGCHRAWPGMFFPLKIPPFGGSRPI